MTDADPFLSPAEKIRIDLAGRTDYETPPVERLTQVTGPQFVAQHADCPVCGNEVGWRECNSGFTPARLCGFAPAEFRGIGETLLVLHPDWRTDEAYVLLCDVDGPAATAAITDLYGPFESVPAAYLWAAEVAARQIADEMGMTLPARIP